MVFDKLTMFANGDILQKDQSASLKSKAVDLRLCNVTDDTLKIFGQVIGGKPSQGSITTTVQHSDDGTTWYDVEGHAMTGDGILIRARIPFGHKRFIRLKFDVGLTALAEQATIFAGLVDNFDQDETPRIQKFPPLEDVAAKGENVNKDWDGQ